MGFTLKETMVWWGDDDSGFAMRPQIKILSAQTRGNGEFGYLENSVGACFIGWAALTERERAAALFAAYTWAVGRDRIPADQAHTEFLQIDEYRRWCETDEGPFAETYSLVHGDRVPPSEPEGFDNWQTVGEALPEFKAPVDD